MKKYSNYLLLLLIGIAILRIPGLFQPILDMDESVFSEFANIILSGGIPYIDALDNKPPLIYYFFAAVYSLFGMGSLAAVHGVTTLVVMATALMVYFLGRETAGKRTGLFAALIFTALAHTYEPKYISTNAETLMNLPLVIASFIFIKYRQLSIKNIFPLMLSGFCIGIAILINYKAGIIAVVFILFSLINSFFPLSSLSQTRNRFLGESARLFITGFAACLPIGIILLYFYHINCLDEFLYWGFSYNFGYISSGTQSVPFIKTFARTGAFVLCCAPAWFIIIPFLKKKLFFHCKSLASGDGSSIHRNFFFILTWFGFSFYAAALGGRTYGHYFIQLIIPLAVLSAMAVTVYFYPGNEDPDSIPGRDFRKTKAFFWGFLCLVTVACFIGRINIGLTYELVHYPNRDAVPAFETVGTYIKKNSSAADKIFAWGWATPVYHFAERRCSSRFLIADFVSGRVFGTPNDSDNIRNEFSKKVMKDFLIELKEKPPVYFIDTAPSHFFGYGRFPLKKYPELAEIIQEEYKLVDSIKKIDIYKRKKNL
ncbi:MAG: hypothetical protein GY754_29280 [bacterium]|nr:hypothetical protein [bacterium]